MDDNMTQDVAPDAEQQTSEGTSDQGQSQDSSSTGTAQDGRANDPELMRADYTRKTMELADMRRALEAEKAEIERMRSTYQYQARAQPEPQHDYSKDSYQSLVNQFGSEGADAILKSQALTQQQLNQIRFESLYSQEEMKGRLKYGDESWSKHNYIDPATGVVKNKVMDYRAMINPLTRKSLTLDEAWALANPVDANKIAMQTKEQTYKEMQKKAQATPAKSTAAPSTTAPKKAMSVSDAYKMAMDELG